MFQTLSFFQIKALITKTRKAESTEKIICGCRFSNKFTILYRGWKPLPPDQRLVGVASSHDKNGIHYTLMVSNALTFNYLLIKNNK